MPCYGPFFAGYSPVVAADEYAHLTTGKGPPLARLSVLVSKFATSARDGAPLSHRETVVAFYAPDVPVTVRAYG
jgi:hypothetical protein